jgi:hypothetical protein
MRAESKFIQASQVDPVIASILGITVSPQIIHTVRTIPNVSARLSKTYPKGVLYLSGGHTVTPGNGLFLTSYATRVMGGYTYTGLRRWAFTSSGGYDSSEATGAIAGNYRTTTGSLAVSRQISESIHLVAEIGVRKYDSGDFSGYNRTVPFGRVGIGFSPGDLPFRLW